MLLEDVGGGKFVSVLVLCGVCLDGGAPQVSGHGHV